MVWLKSQVQVETKQGKEAESPGEPDIEWCRVITEVTSAFSILVSNQNLSEENRCRQPSVTTFNWVVFSLWSVPSFNVVIHFSKTDGAKPEPQNHSSWWEKVFRWNQECVHDEKAIQEMKS